MYECSPIIWGINCGFFTVSKRDLFQSAGDIVDFNGYCILDNFRYFKKRFS